jgi:serine/alanine adding enzyme
MHIRLFREEDRKRWDKYVFEAPDSSCYHLAGWKDVIEKSFGHETYYLLAEGDNGIKGVLPLVRLKSVLFGNFMISVPYFNYGGICADDEETSARLLEAAADIARDKKADYIELRHARSSCGGLPVKTAKVSMRLELPHSREDILKNFSSKLRSQIKRPVKEGMYSRSGRDGELNSFYTVFSTNMRDLGTPVYSKEFFSNILAEFSYTSMINTVYTSKGAPAASGFLVGFKDVLEIPWASSLRSYNRYSPNMLLYWSSLEFARENGYRVFDFGRSTPGEGTYRFKEQWGAKPVQLYWHYWMKNGGLLPELNPRNPKYRMAIEIWRRLPITLTTLVGPAIAKKLP